MKRLLEDQSGSTFLETLIAFPIVFIGFITLMMFARLAVAHVIVQRAATAGARAAVVILPDDPDWYSNGGAASKEDCVKEAVRRVLWSSAFFRTGGSDITVKMTGARSVWAPLTVEVTAQYDCTYFLGSSRFFGTMLCGDDRVADMSASSTLSYQAGELETQ